MTAHAPLAPSSMARTVQCPWSVWAQRQYPGPAETEATREGDAAHWVKAEVTAGRTPVIDQPTPNGVLVTQEMLDGAHLALEEFQRVLGEDWVALLVTERTLPPGTIHLDNWGTPDDWAYFGGKLYLWDYKFGHEPVEVYRNHQLLNYVDLIVTANRLPTNTPCELAIIQPRAHHSDGRVRRWSFDLGFSFWQRQLDDMRGACTAASLGAPEAIPASTGPECKHCTARFACPRLAAEGASAVDSSKINNTPLVLDAGGVAIELALLERAIGVMESRKSGLEEQAVRLIGQGQQVPGYAIGYGQGKTVWTVPDATVVFVGRLNGVELAKPNAAITPLQAQAAGLHPDLLKDFTRSTRGEARLEKASSDKAAQVFGGDR